MNNEENKYWIWFSRIKNVNCVKKERLLEKYKQPSVIWNLESKDLEEIEYLDSNDIKEILDKSIRNNLSYYEEYMRKNDIYIITIFDDIYPKNLKQIYDKPIVLYAKGNLKLLSNQGIAVVGARNCSPYGRKISKEIGSFLANNGVCVISGLAKGIDKYAHEGAIEGKGKTIAVIGNGIDNIYPSENQELARRIIQNNGLILSEYVIGTKPDKNNFPMRNRIISALSNGIVVVEAGKRSGSFITVDFGLEQGKEIFAVPGNIHSNVSIGTNNLIKQGANILVEYEELLSIC